MTSSIERETEDRRNQRQPKRRLSMLEDFVDGLLYELEFTTRTRFPSPLYQNDPVKFFREILGVEPWDRQAEILNAVRDHKRVAVASGHKVSKSHTAAGLALWKYSSWPDARVIFTSTTARQVDQILWRELRMMRARAGRCLECKREDPDQHRIARPCPHSSIIEGDEGALARTGLKAPDFREIVGFTAREAEAVAGISGSQLTYLADEASGIPEIIFEAIEGNLAGGGSIVMFSQGTRNEGAFYDAFHSKSKFYCLLTISSEDTPNVREGREVIPGLATREWIEARKEEYGEHSPWYTVRVKGKFAEHEEGKIFSIHVITEAEKRWYDTAEAGRLFVGLDPAGETGMNDETAFAARRGMKQIDMLTFRGLNDDSHLVHLLHFLTKHRLPREMPVVVLDREGSIGSSLSGKLRAFVETNHDPKLAFQLVSVRASDKAVRQPQIYDRVRDELVANLEAWFRDGGAIIEDTKLEKELHAPEWKPGVNGKLKVTAKEVLRKTIGRSPDRFDALALSVWEPLSLQDPTDLPQSVRAQSGAQRQMDEDRLPPSGIDPYSAADAFKQR